MKALFLCFLATACSGLRGDTIYSTFGPDPSARGFPTYTLGGAYFDPNGVGLALSFGAPFSFSASAYHLDSITFEIGLYTYEGPGGPNLQIGISYDNGGVPALNPITFIQPNPTGTTLDLQLHLITYSFSDSIVLSPNTTYWLTIGPRSVGFSPDAYGGEYQFSSSPLNPVLPLARREFNSAWGNWVVYPNSVQPLFNLNGTPVGVPEPGTWALLALGAAAFGYAARRRRK